MAPRHAVAELELLDLVGPAAEVVAKRELVCRAVADHQLARLALERAHGRGRDVGELGRVGVACRGVVFTDPVHARADGEPVRVIAQAAIERVVADAALQNVCASTAVQGVVAFTAVEHVGHRPAVQRVMAAQAVQAVAAVVKAEQVIVASVAIGQHPRLDLGLAPRHAVAELELLDLVGPATEVVAKRELVCRAVADHQLARLALERAHGRGRDVGELGRVGIACRGVVFTDPVHARADGEPVGVIARAAIERVVALPAVEQVGHRTTIEGVVGSRT